MNQVIILDSPLDSMVNSNVFSNNQKLEIIKKQRPENVDQRSEKKKNSDSTQSRQHQKKQLELCISLNNSRKEIKQGAVRMLSKENIRNKNFFNPLDNHINEESSQNSNLPSILKNSLSNRSFSKREHSQGSDRSRRVSFNQEQFANAEQQFQQSIDMKVNQISQQRLCLICFKESETTLIKPCNCSFALVHLNCLQKQIQSKVRNSKNQNEKFKAFTCYECKVNYNLDLIKKNQIDFSNNWHLLTAVLLLLFLIGSISILIILIIKWNNLELEKQIGFLFGLITLQLILLVLTCKFYRNTLLTSWSIKEFASNQKYSKSSVKEVLNMIMRQLQIEKIQKKATQTTHSQKLKSLTIH